MTPISSDPAAAPPRSGRPSRQRSAEHRSWLSRPPAGLRLAQAGCLLGLLSAAVSVYWALGGARLLDTIGGTLERQGGAGNTGVVIALWVAVVLKTVAAGLPLLALRPLSSRASSRNVWVLAWIEATILTMYGFVLTVVGLLVQVDVIHPAATADRRALAWHAYLWDPWFLLWGGLVAAALLRGRHRLAQAPTPG